MIGSVARSLNEYPCFSRKKLVTVGPPYSQLPHPGIQTIADRKYLKKIPESSKKAKLEFPACRQLFT